MCGEQLSSQSPICFNKLTFLHDAPPPLGPVAQLQGVALFYLGPLLEAADQLVTKTVAIVNPLDCSSVVPWLRTHKHKYTNTILNILHCWYIFQLMVILGKNIFFQK